MAFTNRYPGSCGKCGKNVPAGAGLCEKVNGKFTAFHKSCGAGPVVRPIRHKSVLGGTAFVPSAPPPPPCPHCTGQPCAKHEASAAADTGEAYDFKMGLVF